jgi:hypothetical protein
MMVLDFAFNFPLARAEHRRYGRKKSADLSESRRSLGEGGASFRALRPCRRRAGKRAAPRDTGVFFWFVFFHAEENEQQVRQAPNPAEFSQPINRN